MSDVIKQKEKPSYKDSWWWRLITLAPLLERFDRVMFFIKELTNKQDSHSHHKAINLVWGVGSFICYWVNHFIFCKGKFETIDYIFIAGMAGITTLSAVLTKKFDLKEFKEENKDESSNK